MKGSKGTALSGVQGQSPWPAFLGEVSALGLEGDGKVNNLFVPFVLPGETVEVQLVSASRGLATSVVQPSDDRVQPPCIHFGSCGGCALQHWRGAPYLAWKAEILSASLARAGYQAHPRVIGVAPGARRRADFAVRRTASGVAVGLHERLDRGVIDVHECHVLHPDLVALLPPLRRLVGRLQGFRREGSAIVNLLDSGPDLLLRTDGALTAGDRGAMAAFAGRYGVSRISHGRGAGATETACQLRPAGTFLSGAEVFPPPGAFLQAAGEAAIIDAVLAGLPPKLAKKAVVAELYAGCGTLTFALAKHMRVHAWEGDAANLAALADAGRRHGRVTATLRDLARQPLQAKELAPYPVVVLDPPFAGAGGQMAQIAAAGVPTVIYVSCNPVALSRDAAVLSQAGYRLDAATMIDQFLWSARLEAVAIFSR